LGFFELSFRMLLLPESIFASGSGGSSGFLQSRIVGVGATLGMPSGEAGKDGGKGGGAKRQGSRDGLSERGPGLLGREDQILFGKVVRTNRFSECALIFAMVLSGYGAACALGWGLFGGQRIQPLWIAASAAGPIILLWAAIGLASGNLWVPW
jgi:hypothetical protein